MEIVAKDMIEQDAFNMEKQLIEKYGINNLVNQTIGGISTTGFRHSEETRELQCKIAQQKMLDNPELHEKLTSRLVELHYKQRFDPEYRAYISQLQKDAYAKLSDEEKQLAAKRKTAWLQDPEKKQAAVEKLLVYLRSDENKERASKTLKDRWANMTKEERETASLRSTSIITRPDVREKLLEIRCDKIVVNRKYLFKSKKMFLEATDSLHGSLQKAFQSAEKQGFKFCIYKGYFIEGYDPEKHTQVDEWQGQQLDTLDFSNLPRTKAVVMDESRIFLSMVEASKFCGGKTVEATADFITKNIKLNKPAMGHVWRVATKEEIEGEIMRRLEKISNG